MTADMLQTADARALLAAIDAGDDGALLPLADVLEEAGDRRAMGLRLVDDRRPRRRMKTEFDGVRADLWGWTWLGCPESHGVFPPTMRLPGMVFSRLRDNVLPGMPGHARWYLSRSAAYLALAEALSG